MVRRLTLGGAAALVILSGLVPLLVMLTGTSGGLVGDVLGSRRTWELLGRSVGLASLATLAATVVGVPLGVLLGRTNLPLGHAFPFLFAVPLALPPYVVALSWWSLLGSRLEGLGGCVLVLATCAMPVVLFLTMIHVRGVPPPLEEAARLTTPWPGVLLGVTLPSALPGLLFGPVLAFLLSLGEFGVPMLLRCEVFPAETYTQFAAFHDVRTGTAAAVPLVAVTLIVLALERAAAGRDAFRTMPALSRRGSLEIDLGGARVPLGAAVGLLWIVIVLLPVLVLVRKALAPGAFTEALARSGDSLVRSLVTAGVGATVLALIGFFLGYGIAVSRGAFWRGVDVLTLVLFALPATVLGIGLVSLWNRPGLGWVYSTPAILLVGYVAQFSALPSRIASATLASIPASMDEAARIAGAGWARRTALIVAPLAVRGIAAAWIVSFLFCLRDLGVSMMVYPPGADPLPVRTFTLMANGRPEMIAALCVLLAGATLLPLAALGALLSRRAHR